jgi:D-alanyl-D-alanine carboxypeptidase
VKLGSDRPDSVFDPSDVIAVAMKHPLYFPPGTSCHYSNTNTVLLGLIIQQVAGQTVADAYEQQLFGPLGMSHTSFPDRSSSAIPEPHARGYYFATEEQYAARGLPTDETTWNPSWGWTAGAAISTVHDLATWAPALGTGRLLSRATFAQQTKFIPVPGSTARYGLGMFDFDGYYGTTARCRATPRSSPSSRSNIEPLSSSPSFPPRRSLRLTSWLPSSSRNSPRSSGFHTPPPQI